MGSLDMKFKYFNRRNFRRGMQFQSQQILGESYSYSLTYGLTRNLCLSYSPTASEMFVLTFNTQCKATGLEVKEWHKALKAERTASQQNDRLAASDPGKVQFTPR